MVDRGRANLLQLTVGASRVLVDATMSEQLVGRIRGEFAEMPGLRLTIAQAARLWQADRTICASVLGRLVREQFLYCTPDGAFIRLPAVRASAGRAARGPEERLKPIQL